MVLYYVCYTLATITISKEGPSQVEECSAGLIRSKFLSQADMIHIAICIIVSRLHK